jgi:dynein heavy chain
MKLNAEVVEEDIGNMWRNMHKLAKTFSDRPNPKRSAEITKSKLDKFKQHLPLLQTFCNPGIRERHWDRMSEIVGFDLKPEPTTPLSVMIEYGLDKHLEKLEEIGAAASKEHSLEKALEKMKSEWKDTCFNFIPYRDTVRQIIISLQYRE